MRGGSEMSMLESLEVDFELFPLTPQLGLWMQREILKYNLIWLLKRE